LIAHFEKEGIDYKKWLISGQEHALNYKMRIEPLGDIKIFDIEYHKKKFDKEGKRVPAYDNKCNKIMATLPTFFANMGDDWKKNPKKLSWSPHGINITIKAFHTELMDAISGLMARFMATHNFGMRQSKGFGSFSVVEIDGKKLEEDMTRHFDYCFDVNINEMNYKVHYVDQPEPIYLDMEKLFYAIHRFHQTIRSGINENGFYFKPMMFFYAKEKGHQWDKKTFKQEFLPTDCLNAQKKKYRDDSPVAFDDGKKQHYLFRDLLGLSTSQLWRMAPKKLGNCDRKYGFSIRHPKKNDKYDGKHLKPNKIERFHSPFLYKPIAMGNNLYRVGIVLSPIPEKMLNGRFTIIKDNRRNEEIEDIIQDMPVYPDFNIEEFFSLVFERRKSVDNQANNPKHEISKNIINLYSTLTKV
jgi:hypothetical protein